MANINCNELCLYQKQNNTSELIRKSQLVGIYHQIRGNQIMHIFYSLEMIEFVFDDRCFINIFLFNGLVHFV